MSGPALCARLTATLYMLKVSISPGVLPVCYSRAGARRVGVR